MYIAATEERWLGLDKNLILAALAECLAGLGLATVQDCFQKLVHLVSRLGRDHEDSCQIEVVAES